MAGIIFIIVQVVVLFIFAGCTPVQASTETTTGVNVSLSEVITILSFIGGLFGVWIDVRLRIKSLEIKTKQNETIIKENKVENYSDMCEIKQILKENATTTRDELKNITEQVNSLHVMFAEKFGKS